MIDNDIIKAWKCCTSTTGSCEKCPRSIDGKICSPNEFMELIKFTFEFITRQNAENEKLKKESDEWARRFINRCRDYELEIQQNEKLKAEIERLKIRNDELNALHKTASIEAIREFTEQLKSVSHPYADTQMVFELQIDNLLKEMVGDE